MSHARLGKLPPLQAIGRSVSVDLDEPPDLGDDSDVDNLIEEYENYERGYFYQPEHSTAAAESFYKFYKILQPGNHVCKCASSEEAGAASSFTHCAKGVAYGQKYQELHRQLEIKARLEFIKDYTVRIQQLSNFLESVKLMVKEEYQTWRAICKSHLQSPPSTQLESLQAVCEEIHFHRNHWNSIKQTVLMDKWLRPALPFISRELTQIRNKLFYLRNCLLWWTDRLITLGLRVLAHCDPSHLSQEMLWAVTRGIEEFNSIVNIVKLENMHCNFTSSYNNNNASCSPALISPFKSATHINMYCNLVEGIKPIPFSRVLNVLAHERSKYAAVMTHNFYTASEDFLHTLRVSKLPEYNWSECKSNKPVRAKSPLESSDYYTQSGSNVSLGSALLRVGTVIAPDLSAQDAAVAEFAKREREFAIKFLQIVNKSTKLLKRPQDNISSPTNSSSRFVGNSSTPPASRKSAIAFNSASTDEFSSKQSRNTSPLGHRRVVGLSSVSNEYFKGSTQIGKRNGDGSTLVAVMGNEEDNISLCSVSSSTFSTRKSVSWGDTSEGGALKQLSDKYMDMLWQFYEQEMMTFLNGTVVGGISAGKTQLGNIVLCDDITTIMIVSMINQTCLKDIFPPGAVVPLYNLARKLQVMTAWKAWDKGNTFPVNSALLQVMTAWKAWDKEYCSALAGQTTDRCAATPLAEEEFCTKTAHRLRETFQPLHSAISILQLKPNMTEREKSACLALVAPTLQRYIVTCELALSWCTNKCDEFLSQWNASSFLLVTQSDLKIVSDEVHHVLCSSQHLCSSPKTSNRNSSLHQSTEGSQLYEKLNNISSQLQTLSGSSIKRFADICRHQAEEFFQEAMPVGKIWRKKPSHGLPTERSEYIELALQSLLEPVVSGINKLRTTSQISSVSVASRAMCEAWSQHILKNKIKFSYIGACQLELDFEYVQEWLSSYLRVNEPVQQSILSLDIFKYLTQGIQLLKQQPHSSSLRPSSNNSRSCSRSVTAVETTELDTVSSIQPSTTGTHSNSDRNHNQDKSPYTVRSNRIGATDSKKANQAANGADNISQHLHQKVPEIHQHHNQPQQHPHRLKSISQVFTGNQVQHFDEVDCGDIGGDVVVKETKAAGVNHDYDDVLYKMDNKEQWLALRVQGGARNWPKLPNCFPSTS